MPDFNGNKIQRAASAQKHTDRMAKLYDIEISNCITNTKIYSGLSKKDYQLKSSSNIKMSVIEKDTVSALFDLDDSAGKLALLNFASYKHPGGGFMVGSRAQEEALCQESFLYNVLREFECTYYIENRNSLNKGLYRNRALYSPSIRFIRDDRSKTCDVLTCASPNFSAASSTISREENNKVLAERVRFILETVKTENVDTFIAGAFGCGVFKQDPKVLSRCFSEEAKKVFADKPIHLIFAIPTPLPNQIDNLTPFVKLVDEWNNLS